jgi:hypothetical protein
MTELTDFQKQLSAEIVKSMTGGWFTGNVVAELRRLHAEGFVTVGHMRQQIAAEREACAKVCFGFEGADPLGVSLDCAAAIRAREQA